MFVVVVVLFALKFSSTVKVKSGESQKNVYLFMATDENFIPPTTVSLVSLFENRNQSTFYYVHVLIPGKFEIENKSRISSLEVRYNRCKIVLKDMGDRYKNAPRIHIKCPAYYRLDIPSLFLDLNKCIYIDSDVIIRHDLWEMYNTNVDDYYVGGIYEGFLHFGEEETKRFEFLGLPNVNQYICSGVMIMNLKKMREDKVEEKFCKFIEEKGNYLREISFFYADQEIINTVCYGKILFLPIKFGLMVNMVREKVSPIIVHFAGCPKPWKNPEKTKYHWEFWYYARKTSFYRSKITLRKSRKTLQKNPERRHFKTQKSKTSKDRRLRFR